jgi:uncharacterized protein YndB with AHSA1/START domain
VARRRKLEGGPGTALYSRPEESTVMPLESLELSTLIAASPDDVYAAWMSAKGHAAFTGAAATVTPRVGNRHTAWDGYIHGWVLKVGPGRRAVFSWRTTDFAPADYDSVVELSVERAKEGARVKLYHWEIPEGQGERYAKGWQDFYFEPLAKHFAAKKKKKKPAAKKKAAGQRSRG